MIKQKPMPILTNFGASLSYVSPTIMETYKLEKVKHNKSWLA